MKKPDIPEEVIFPFRIRPIILGKARLRISGQISEFLIARYLVSGNIRLPGIWYNQGGQTLFSVPINPKFFSIR